MPLFKINWNLTGSYRNHQDSDEVEADNQEEAEDGGTVDCPACGEVNNLTDMDAY